MPGDSCQATLGTSRRHRDCRPGMTSNQSVFPLHGTQPSRQAITIIPSPLGRRCPAGADEGGRGPGLPPSLIRPFRPPSPSGEGRENLPNRHLKRKPLWVGATALTGTLVVLSHPEWVLQTIAVGLILWFFRGRDRQGTLMSIAVGIGVAALSMPWWLPVIQRHGAQVFFQAGQATKSRWLFWTIPLTMGFTGEYTPVIAVLAVCGLFLHLAKKDFLLPAWALFSLFADPRGGLPASVFPFSILAMTALADGLAIHLSASGGKTDRDWTDSLQTNLGRAFWGVFILIFLYGAFRVSSTLSRQSLDTEERDALQWVSVNTATNDRFLVLDRQENSLLSPLLEWFPALTNRRSITTVQGSEWLAGDQGFQAQMKFSQSVHPCIFEDAKCLQVADGQYDFILLSFRDGNGDARPFPLFFSLERTMDAALVYSTPEIRIFQVQRQSQGRP